MKISCPKCNAKGSIPEHEIPETGRFINCPRCKERFSITRPQPTGTRSHLVDICPSCSYSTFGDEPFSTCPKCGIEVKTYVERQREEQIKKHNQELLSVASTTSEAQPPDTETASTADFIDNLHPVNLISWGVAAGAIICIGIGLWGLAGYDSVAVRALLMEQNDKPVSDLYLFLHYGLSHWVKLLFGLSALVVSILFIKRLKVSLLAMKYLIWAAIVLVPLSYVIGFIYWVLAPIPHPISGYLIEVVNILFMTALFDVPLYLLGRHLQNRKITAAVNL